MEEYMSYFCPNFGPNQIRSAEQLFPGVVVRMMGKGNIDSTITITSYPYLDNKNWVVNSSEGEIYLADRSFISYDHCMWNTWNWLEKVNCEERGTVENPYGKLMVEISYDGQKYIFNGVYKIPDVGDYYLGEDGRVKREFLGNCIGEHNRRAIVSLVQKIHKFGEVSFVEEEKVRRAEPDEWFLMGDVPTYAPQGTICRHKILKKA